MKSGGKKNDKGTVYCEFMCLIFPLFPHSSKNHPPGGDCYSGKYVPLFKQKAFFSRYNNDLSDNTTYCFMFVYVFVHMEKKTGPGNF